MGIPSLWLGSFFWLGDPSGWLVIAGSDPACMIMPSYPRGRYRPAAPL